MIKQMLLPAIVIALIGVSLSACYSHLNQPTGPRTKADKYDIDRTVEGIVYTRSGWPQALQADLYLPRKTGPQAVVVVIHGGGWANRGRNDMTSISRKLTRHGYAVFNVSYRFAPRYTYPAQLRDLEQAMRWIVDNASKYNLDVSRINTWGYSSGAHLAALIASFDKSAGDSGLPAVRSVVAGGIPSDLRKYSGSPIVMRFMGGDRHEMPERYAEASPTYHISEDDPPVFLYHGKLDSLVGVDQATDYFEALRAAGIETELYLHDWREHMTMFLFGGGAEERAIDFLNRKNERDHLLTTELK